MFINRKRLLYLLFLNCFLSNALAQNHHLVTISGFVRNFNNSIIVEEQSEMEGLSLPNNERFFLPDSNNRFSISFKLDKPNYFRIGRNILYLSPGDVINADIDFNKPAAAKFLGKHALENEYLRNTPYPKMGSFLEAEDGIKNSVEETVEAIKLKVKFKRNILRKLQSKLDKTFYQLENVRINADAINALISMHIYYPYVHKTPKDSLAAVHQEIDKKIKDEVHKYSKGIVNPSFLKLLVYRKVIKTILSELVQPFNIPKNITDWQTGNDIRDKALDFEKKEDIQRLIKDAVTIKNVGYKNRVIHTLKQLTLLNTGDVAIDVPLLNMQQQKVMLSAYKGRVIYIDLWATWCGPCVKDKPNLEKMRVLLKDYPEVVILSASLDEDTKKWQNYLSNLGNVENEFIIDRNLWSGYNIVSIPRMIMIDKDFRIVNLNAPEPADTQTVTLLKKLVSAGKSEK